MHGFADQGVVRGKNRARRGTRGGDLFGRQRHRDGVRAPSAVGIRHREAHQPEFAHALHDLRREAALVYLRRYRGAISRSQKSRTMSRTIFCSSVKKPLSCIRQLSCEASARKYPTHKGGVEKVPPVKEAIPIIELFTVGTGLRGCPVERLTHGERGQALRPSDRRRGLSPLQKDRARPPPPVHSIDSILTGRQCSRPLPENHPRGIMRDELRMNYGFTPPG